MQTTKFLSYLSLSNVCACSHTHSSTCTRSFTHSMKGEGERERERDYDKLWSCNSKETLIRFSVQLKKVDLLNQPVNWIEKFHNREPWNVFQRLKNWFKHQFFNFLQNFFCLLQNWLRFSWPGDFFGIYCPCYSSNYLQLPLQCPSLLGSCWSCISAACFLVKVH